MTRLVNSVTAGALLLLCALAATEAARPTWWQWLLLGSAAVPVAVRDRWPLPVLAVTAGSAAALLGSGIVPAYAAPPPAVAVALSVYSVAAATRRTPAVVALAATLVTAVVPALWEPAALLVAVPVAAVPWTVGRLVRHRRALADRLAEERADRAVVEERLRIARDMHDSVAHHLSVITMKASVARHVAAARPEEAADALGVIEESGREALVDVRRAVGLLRDDDHDLTALVTRVERAGLAVDLTADPVPEALRPIVHRIVQEALTNIVRHAAATRCTVAVAAGPSAVEVQVTDDGSGPAAKGSSTNGPGAVDEGGGHGLIGMRERVTAAGGRLETGFRSGGGFVVRASLPDPAAVTPGRPCG